MTDATGSAIVRTRYGLTPGAIEEAFRATAGQPVPVVITALLRGQADRSHALSVALLLRDGCEVLADEISRRTGEPVAEVLEAVDAYLQSEAAEGILLTGAEVVALILSEVGTRTVFAYAGTSELALCDALSRMNELELLNGRGDKESAFMAVGASLLEPWRGAAVLHGARGLTNAAGAIADARRNEGAGVLIVGLPSTGSAGYLPPHAENGLMAGIGRFAKWWYEAPAVPDDGPERTRAAHEFVVALRSAVRCAGTKPFGPTLFGVAQDVAETAWIPWSAVGDAKAGSDDPAFTREDMLAVVDLVRRARSPVIIIDDYFLRPGGAREVLAEFAARIGAPVLQVRYRRGPMLFERLSRGDVDSFLGWYEPADPDHQSLLATSDLLITLEDRNMYPRVIGELPAGRKLAISSDSVKVAKNGYLGAGDVVVEGDPVAILRTLNEQLALLEHGPQHRAWTGSATQRSGRSGVPVVEALRCGIVQAISDALADASRPVIVDDSQMFGGLVSLYYDLLPSHVRVFGGHGGFVGSGVSYATGLALAEPSARVFGLLGDQGFTNNLQGLVAAGERRANVLYLVCNNGESVSLVKQSGTQPRWLDTGRSYLGNAASLDYAGVAAHMGVAAAVVDFRERDSGADVADSLVQFRERIREAVERDGPSLIEMRLPSLGDFWRGVWSVSGVGPGQPRAAEATTEGMLPSALFHGDPTGSPA